MGPMMCCCRPTPAKPRARPPRVNKHWPLVAAAGWAHPVSGTHIQPGAWAKARAISLATELRAAELAALVAPARSLKAQMRYASALASPAVLILGDQELERGTVTLRNMTTADQQEAAADGVHDALRGMGL